MKTRNDTMEKTESTQQVTLPQPKTGKRKLSRTSEISPDSDSHQQFFDHCPVDYSGKQFACLHNRCPDFLSCFRQDVLHEYLTFHALRFHPKDRSVWCKQVYPDILNFARYIPDNELPNYRISFNHRYINQNNNISQFLHEGTLFSTDDPFKPVLILKVFSEIGDIKADDSIVLTISEYDEERGYVKVFSKTYSDSPHTILTSRELEIISWCHQGLSSKMIADKLNLSIHTVKNHKRNIMEKTMTHNITELIHLCIQNRWLIV